jgi:hypothetical protein
MDAITGWERFASDLIKSFGQEFCDDFARTLIDEVKAEQEVVHAHVQGRQRRIAEATSRLEQCYFDGLGEMHMRVDSDVFFNWVMREGREIWNDPGFIKEFKRDNPDVRVLTKSRKAMVMRP